MRATRYTPRGGARERESERDPAPQLRPRQRARERGRARARARGEGAGAARALCTDAREHDRAERDDGLGVLRDRRRADDGAVQQERQPDAERDVDDLRRDRLRDGRVREAGLRELDLGKGGRDGRASASAPTGPREPAPLALSRALPRRWCRGSGRRTRAASCPPSRTRAATRCSRESARRPRGLSEGARSLVERESGESAGTRAGTRALSPREVTRAVQRAHRERAEPEHAHREREHDVVAVLDLTRGERARESERA